MSYSFKTSNKGFDIDPKKNRSEGCSQNESPPREDSIIWPLAIAYLQGAKIQLIRYQEAVAILQKNAIEGVILCLHETSCLFEDLAVIAIYLNSLGKTHEYSDQFIMIRDHIRHDVRENLDKKDEKRKIRRLKSLKMKEHLQMDINFDPKYIKVGEIKVTVDQIEEYLRWADSIFKKLFEQGEKSGHIKINNVEPLKK